MKISKLTLIKYAAQATIFLPFFIFLVAFIHPESDEVHVNSYETSVIPNEFVGLWTEKTTKRVIAIGYSKPAVRLPKKYTISKCKELLESNSSLVNSEHLFCWSSACINILNIEKICDFSFGKMVYLKTNGHNQTELLELKISEKQYRLLIDKTNRQLIGFDPYDCN